MGRTTLSQRRWPLALLFAFTVATVLAAVFQKQIRIAYHTARLRDNVHFFVLEQGKAPKLNFLHEQWIRLGHGTPEQERNAMLWHTHALMDLGYLIREEFSLQNRLYAGTNRIAFYQQVSTSFGFGTWEAVDGDHWWDLFGTESNKVVVTTTPALMPRWKKLVEDFDRP